MVSFQGTTWPASDSDWKHQEGEMDNRNEPRAAGREFFLPDPTRRDIVKAYAVEIAINIVALVGARQAAAFLYKYKVDLDVALRVLLRPSQRRNYIGQNTLAMEGILPVQWAYCAQRVADPGNSAALQGRRHRIDRLQAFAIQADAGDLENRQLPVHAWRALNAWSWHAACIISFSCQFFTRHLEMETSAEMIEFLVGAVGGNSSEYDRQIFERALRELVRIAQAEKIAAIEQDFITAERAASQNYRPLSWVGRAFRSGLLAGRAQSLCLATELDQRRRFSVNALLMRHDEIETSSCRINNESDRIIYIPASIRKTAAAVQACLPIKTTNLKAKAILVLKSRYRAAVSCYIGRCRFPAFGRRAGESGESGAPPRILEQIPVSRPIWSAPPLASLQKTAW
jgi:hypothetical protein